jgi:WD40 repeat protein
VKAVVISPDGLKIVSGSHDKTIKIWDFNGTLLKTLTGHKDSIYTVAISADGLKIFAGSSDKLLKVWTSLALVVYKVQSQNTSLQPYISRENIDIQDSNGKTATMLAASMGCDHAVLNFLSYGADINLQHNNSRMTALMLAADNGHASTVKILIEKGADINVVDIQKRSPLALSLSSANKEVQLLIFIAVIMLLYTITLLFNYSTGSSSST